MTNPQEWQPSTAWVEKVAADEPQRLERYAQQLVQIQARKSRRQGPGRALHRKQVAAASGYLQVLDGLPEFARHGLFAQPATYEAWVRLSNGSMDHASDRKPDIRGFALRVLGVSGPSALGQAQTPSQDFTLINLPKFALGSSAEFVDFVVAAARGPGAAVGHLVRRYGFKAGMARLITLAASVARRFEGFANNTFWSVVPFACGPYAVRARLVPAPGNGLPNPKARHDWGADFAQRLRQGALEWELQLQPYVHESLTPIEDASVDWPSPYTTVARLTLPAQSLDSAQALAFAQQVENSVFDSWQALREHRPLGDVQRARKVAYYASQQARGAGKTADT